MAKGSGHAWQPPAHLNPAPPTSSVPKGHPPQDKGRQPPGDSGSNTNLKGFGGGSTGGGAGRGAEGSSQDRY